METVHFLENILKYNWSRTCVLILKGCYNIKVITDQSFLEMELNLGNQV